VTTRCRSSWLPFPEARRRPPRFSLRFLFYVTTAVFLSLVLLPLATAYIQASVELRKANSRLQRSEQQLEYAEHLMKIYARKKFGRSDSG